MTIKITAGPPARPTDRAYAKARYDLHADELPRIRAGAIAWRNGLGALLAGLIGFSLIKGRSDVTQLRSSYAVLVGLLLLAALLAGVVAAVLVMRAAHGRPYAAALPDRGVLDPGVVARRAEADASEHALRWGVGLAFGCVALLTAAVGVTWYGPAKAKPRLEVQLADGSQWCGEPVSVAAGRLTLKTAQGQVSVDLTRAMTITAVDTCRN
ncbi:hypothetical protein ACIA5C_48020 [Actinoplanes sp. NPDC051343]|uniref:hypothetical protein n=1 Tax=Actinoplanes sp. NPDC051343 TaxID=3363906 RepID=UPI0037AD1092